jgi:hypothetical protein
VDSLLVECSNNFVQCVVGWQQVHDVHLDRTWEKCPKWEAYKHTYGPDYLTSFQCGLFMSHSLGHFTTGVKPIFELFLVLFLDLFFVILFLSDSLSNLIYNHG